MIQILYLCEEILLFLLSPGFASLTMILFYVLIDRKHFGSIVIYSLFSTFINAILKNIWKIPLKAGVGHEHWYAYPSGHTQFAIVCCCCLAIAMRSWRLLIVLSLLIFIYCASIVDRGFHDWNEVIGAIIPSLLLAIVYYGISYTKLYQQGNFYYFGLIIAIIELVLINKMDHLPCDLAYCKFDWLWISWGFSLGLTISWMIFDHIFYKKRLLKHVKNTQKEAKSQKNYLGKKAFLALYYDSSFYNILQKKSKIRQSRIKAILQITLLIIFVLCLNLFVQKLRKYFIYFSHIETFLAFIIGILITYSSLVAKQLSAKKTE